MLTNTVPWSEKFIFVTKSNVNRIPNNSETDFRLELQSEKKMT